MSQPGDPTSAPPPAPPAGPAPMSTSSVGESAARRAVMDVRDEVGKVIVGQQGVLSGVITALLVNGHVLLEGVPGTAKTLLAKTLAASF